MEWLMTKKEYVHRNNLFEKAYRDHPGEARMTSSRSEDHGFAMTWSLCDHHPGEARMTSSRSEDHGKAVTRLASSRLCLDDVRAKLG
jgi:hypothetical protein